MHCEWGVVDLAGEGHLSYLPTNKGGSWVGGVGLKTICIWGPMNNILVLARHSAVAIFDVCSHWSIKG